MEIGINNLGVYIVGTILTIVVPGANTYRVLQGVKQFGFLGGAYASAGVMLADFFFMIAAAMGIGVIIHSNEWAYLLLLLVGGLYFFLLGSSILQNWRISMSHSMGVLGCPTSHSSKMTKELRMVFKSAFLTCIVNFKAIFFYGLFLPTFIDKDYSPSWVPLFVLCAICALLLLTYYFLLSYLGIGLFSSKHGDKIFSCLSLLFGIFIVGLSIKIFIEGYSVLIKLSVF